MIARLQRRVLPRDSAELRAKIDQEIAGLTTALAAKHNEIAQLMARVAELERWIERLQRPFDPSLV